LSNYVILKLLPWVIHDITKILFPCVDESHRSFHSIQAPATCDFLSGGPSVKLPCNVIIAKLFIMFWAPPAVSSSHLAAAPGVCQTRRMSNVAPNIQTHKLTGSQTHSQTHRRARLTN